MYARRSGPRTRRNTPRVVEVCEPPARNVRQRRCRCETCASCQDNARWDRIFQSKFADPDYYVRRVVRHDSSLNPI